MSSTPARLAHRQPSGTAVIQVMTALKFWIPSATRKHACAAALLLIQLPTAAAPE